MKKIFLVLILGFFVSFSMASAFSFVKPENENGNLSISSSEEYKNLYTVGSEININGSVKGDLVAAGGEFSLVGPVEQDVNIAGGNITISGPVGGDVRLAGGSVNISGKIDGDFLAAGGKVKLSEASNVKGDVAIAGGNIDILAPVSGDLKLAGENIVINSKIEGSVRVRASQTLTFGPKAEISGKIFYSGLKEAVVKDGAKISQVEFVKLDMSKQKYLLGGLLTLGFVVKIVAFFLVGWLLMRLFRKTVFETSEIFIKNLPSSFFWGFAFLVLVPIISILLITTFVGYYLGIIALLLYVLILLVNSVFSCLVVGKIFLEKVLKQNNELVDWQLVLIGVVLFLVFKSLPFVGWVFGGFVYLTTLGSLIVIFRNLFKQNN